MIFPSILKLVKFLAFNGVADVFDVVDVAVVVIVGAGVVPVVVVVTLTDEVCCSSSDVHQYDQFGVFLKASDFKIVYKSSPTF